MFLGVAASAVKTGFTMVMWDFYDNEEKTTELQRLFITRPIRQVVFGYRSVSLLWWAGGRAGCVRFPVRSYFHDGFGYFVVLFLASSDDPVLARIAEAFGTDPIYRGFITNYSSIGNTEAGSFPLTPLLVTTTQPGPSPLRYPCLDYCLALSSQLDSKKSNPIIPLRSHRGLDVVSSPLRVSGALRCAAWLRCCCAGSLSSSRLCGRARTGGCSRD